MTAGEQARRSAAHRYAPFLAIVAVELLLLTVTGTRSTTQNAVVRSGGAQGASLAPGAVATDDVSAGAGASPTAGNTGAGSVAVAAASGSASRGAATAHGSTAAAGAPTGRAVAASTGGGAVAGSMQPVDGLGRPTSGDKSKCAPGGLLQENVTLHSPPCIPAFTGDNGGATYQGVTKDTINVVLMFPQYPDAINTALTANGLSASPEQYHEIDSIFAQFINKHYELYGRQVKVQEYFTACQDPACIRADAKAVNEKFHPFAAAWYVDGITTDALWDQFAQLCVVTVGAPPLSDQWFKQHAPYAWKDQPQGFRAADMLADYYCKKMWGKNATLAGDPTLRVKRRKLGIIALDMPGAADVAQHFKSQVSGGMCGSPADGTTIYTTSADTDQRANEAPALVARMKADGITTQTSFAGAAGSQEDDKQGFYPENLMSGLPQADDDFVGRFSAATGSPTQMGNTFGIGWMPKQTPAAQHEHMKVAHDVNPSYDPPYVAEGPWRSLAVLAKLFQWAGPHLTPQNLEQGAHTSPQINGYINAMPWPGWKCCNPFAQEYNFAGPNAYSGQADAREVYWSSTAISPVDNQPGSWVCVNDCKRFAVGQWPKGEPKQ